MSSVAGAPSTGSRCTNSVMRAAALQTASSSRPSTVGGVVVRRGRTVTRPVSTPASPSGAGANPAPAPVRPAAGATGRAAVPRPARRGAGGGPEPEPPPSAATAEAGPGRGATRAPPAPGLATAVIRPSARGRAGAGRFGRTRPESPCRTSVAIRSCKANSSSARPSILTISRTAPDSTSTTRATIRNCSSTRWNPPATSQETPGARLLARAALVAAGDGFRAGDAGRPPVHDRESARLLHAGDDRLRDPVAQPVVAGQARDVLEGHDRHHRRGTGRGSRRGLGGPVRLREPLPAGHDHTGRHTGRQHRLDRAAREGLPGRQRLTPRHEIRPARGASLPLSAREAGCGTSAHATPPQLPVDRRSASPV